MHYVRSLEELGFPDAILLPGTKSTLADLEWMWQTGLAQAVNHFAQSGGAVVGICGGYQMLGARIDDPQHVESRLNSLEGLNLLPIATRFLPEKATFLVDAQIKDGSGWLAGLNGTTLGGYEIHMGETSGKTPWLNINHRNGELVQISDGSVSTDGKIWGCYLHGIFANDAFRHAWLESLGRQSCPGISQAESFQQSLDILANAVESALNMELLEKMIWKN